jgi:hypothetical protein
MFIIAIRRLRGRIGCGNCVRSLQPLPLPGASTTPLALAVLVKLHYLKRSRNPYALRELVDLAANKERFDVNTV